MSIRQLLEADPDAGMAKFEEKIKPLGLSQGAQKKLISMFKSAFLSGNIEIDWNKVIPLKDEEMFPYDQIPEPENPQEILKQLIVVKLNGGLGTTMGCTCPKSLIVCQNGQTFFDIVVDQLKDFNSRYNVDIPLVLMHSFNTDKLMEPVIEKVQGLKIITFNQNKFPRIYEDTYEPVPTSPDSPLSMWNPPGHADVYHCLDESGLLDQFIREGKRYMMISNIDNLGARIDLKILNKVLKDDIPYACETVDKTPEEWKGGMPIYYEGHLKLLETAQVPPDHMDDYVAIHYFHANNLWVNLLQLKEAIQNDTLKIDVMKNYKTFEGRKVIQLESACGSAIQSFERSIAIKVPRRRFMPVKACNELLLMRSDLYIKHENSELLLNPKRTTSGLPAVSLGKEFQRIEDFEKRIKCPPSIYNLKKLVVEGDVIFGKNIVLEGDVIIKAENGKKLVLPDGLVLKDCTYNGE
ncbi:UTP--glucose-1-phosphate uridylyltransferase family protein [Histomonas meleagridis]|uniref:UTP--glucose-1-phosphate uridylyltransferase family protein n=1 Tax=Histomonas meleagridis TaxID=135588 RepID=UPI00355AC6C4|nr:UTP--glucose-1-phosphate uridylyltransferase family protein [Histomonas meleagridis]KAH0803187.1 UTP--glucose-1-phosphate uridylyltransferase family protein [Histomonas meleagridis]